MRYIVIPQPETLIPGERAIDYTFAQFLREFVWRDERWVSDAAWEDVMSEIAGKLDKASTGDVVELLDAQWEKLAQVARSKSVQFAPHVVIELTVLVRAITGAKAADPRPQQLAAAAE